MSEEWEDKYNELIRDGEKEDNTYKLANREFDECIVKINNKMYRQYLTNGLLLLNGDVHGNVRKPFCNIGIKDTTPGKPQHSL